MRRALDPAEAAQLERVRYVDTEKSLRAAIAAAAASSAQAWRIVVVGAIALTRTVVLPAAAPGLVLEGAGVAMLAADGLTAISLRGDRQVVRGLYVRGATTVITVPGAIADVTIEGLVADACTTFVSGPLTRAAIRGNSCGGGAINTSSGAGGNILAVNRNPGTKTLHATDKDLDTMVGAIISAIADKRVLFSDGGAVAGAAQVHYDKTNGRLGVGTTSPQTLAHVSGVLRITDTSNETQPNEILASVADFIFRTRGNFNVIVDTDGNAASFSDAFKVWLTSTTGTPLFQVGAKDGFVGINTAAAQYGLDVRRANADGVVGLHLAGTDAQYKDVVLTDTTSGEKWAISHRATSNFLEFYYYNGATWTLVQKWKLTGTQVVSAGDLVVGTVGKGPVLRSPDGNYWRITVSNAGALAATSLGASEPA